jgi:hypothetical protein
LVEKRVFLGELDGYVGAAFVDWSYVEQIDSGEVVSRWDFQGGDALLPLVYKFL